MNVCLIYSGWLRTWDQCKANHEVMLKPFPSCVIHYNEHHGDMKPCKYEHWKHYRENKAPETEPENTMCMWRNMYEAFQSAPDGLDCYVRTRYDIIFDRPINFEQYEMTDDTVYIPTGNDYRDGVNDQFAFGSYAAMTEYHNVFLDHSIHFAAGKAFHSESYLKYTLEMRGIKIIRIPAENTIVR